MRKIKRAYFLTIFIIAITVLISQIITQNFISGYKYDSTVVNISGRQRMLSQQISKSALQMINSKDSIYFNQKQRELSSASETFLISHKALQFGDENLGIKKVGNSPQIKKYFGEILSSFESIYYSSKSLSTINFDQRQSQDALSHLNSILENEAAFLTTMNDITFQFDRETVAKSNKLSQIELVLFLLTIIILVVEVLFIFKPAIKIFNKSTQKLIQNEKKLEAERVKNKYLNEIESKNRDLEQYAYVISHDLQEPLNTIISFSKLISTRTSDVELVKKSLKAIESSSYRMKEDISSLLEHSMIGIDIAKQELNVEQIIDDITSDLKSLIDVNNGRVINKVKDVLVSYDKSELSKLFQNLITNGLKYHRDNVSPVVTIDYTDTENEYIFSVNDNGIGIDEGDFIKIFEVFKRLHSRDKYGGVGIGLSTCKKIIQANGGSIWLESKKGSGTTIYFSILKNV